MHRKTRFEYIHLLALSNMPKQNQPSRLTHDRRRVISKDDKNLNQRVKDVGRRTQSVFVRGGNKVHVLFDGPNIKRAINRMINRKGTEYIVGCVTYLSNKDILKNMAKKRGICIVLTRDKETQNPANQKLYSKLTPSYPGGALRVAGDKGRGKASMHHRFLIGLDLVGEPQWVINGTFDMTESATTNIENIMILEDEDVSKCYMEEFKRMYALSKTLKINHII